MRRYLLFCFVLTTAVGCANLRTGDADRPGTLFEWAIGGKDEQPKEDDAKEEKNGDEEKKDDAGDKANGTKENGNGSGNGTSEPKPSKRDEPLASDRPDFVEASSTVGRGIVQLESGYTLIRSHDAVSRSFNHSYPEALFRIGLFADWFELRIGQNFSSNNTTGAPAVTGAEDLYLGTKLALTEQKKALPEMALVLQMTVPSGHAAFSAGEVLPGFNWLIGWDVIEDRINSGMSLQVNRGIDDIGQVYVEWATAVTIGYTLAKHLGAYTEYFAIYPDGARGATAGSQHYFDGGFIFPVTNNLQFDIRGGIGLNDRADDYFFGAGVVIRR